MYEANSNKTHGFTSNMLEVAPKRDTMNYLILRVFIAGSKNADV